MLLFFTMFCCFKTKKCDGLLKTIFVERYYIASLSSVSRGTSEVDFFFTRVCELVVIERSLLAQIFKAENFFINPLLRIIRGGKNLILG